MEVTLGMVPLIIKPIYALYSGPLLKGSNTGVPQTAVWAKPIPRRVPRPLKNTTSERLGNLKRKTDTPPKTDMEPKNDGF